MDMEKELNIIKLFKKYKALKKFRGTSELAEKAYYRKEAKSIEYAF